MSELYILAVSGQLIDQGNLEYPPFKKLIAASLDNQNRYNLSILIMVNSGNIGKMELRSNLVFRVWPMSVVISYQLSYLNLSQ